MTPKAKGFHCALEYRDGVGRLEIAPVADLRITVRRPKRRPIHVIVDKAFLLKAISGL